VVPRLYCSHWCFRFLPQITSEQIVREAKELQEKDFKAPTRIITNETELGEYRLRKRKEYEDTLRMKRWNLNWWMRVSGPCGRTL
jgi:crooked neck